MRVDSARLPCGRPPCQPLVRSSRFARDLADSADKELAQVLRTVRALLIAGAALPCLIAWVAAGLLALGYGWLTVAILAAGANAAVFLVLHRSLLRWLRSGALARTRRMNRDPAAMWSDDAPGIHVHRDRQQRFH